ncbi:MAG: phosphonopyruvate decarboxylase [Rhodospirillaceae bacterium]|nr:MAG: phosphonopyruvate decarboxylase [Rhodospirillaceae bacterium]
MIRADDFLLVARTQGFDFYSGVPCSFLTPLINRVIGDPATPYVGATSEGEAVAIAAGAWLAGRQTVVMCQNSGLGNTVNPLTSLNAPFRIPVLLVVTWRGQPGRPDEPQHALMGPITPALLDLMQIPNRPFPESVPHLMSAFADARAVMDRYGVPFAFVMAQGAVADEALREAPRAPPSPGMVVDLCRGVVPPRPTRAAVLACVLAMLPKDAAVIATTGKCGRELFTLADRVQHFYLVGAMGGASALGLGVALNTTRPVVVLDGDGAALMRMGNIATIGAHGPCNLIHILLDNGVHDSTGGQATVSAGVSFARVAGACGYTLASVVDTVTDFEEALRQALAQPGPHMIHGRLLPGSMPKLGRPTVKPEEVARRFKDFLKSDVVEKTKG